MRIVAGPEVRELPPRSRWDAEKRAEVSLTIGDLFGAEYVDFCVTYEDGGQSSFAKGTTGKSGETNATAAITFDARSPTGSIAKSIRARYVIGLHENGTNRYDDAGAVTFDLSLSAGA